ncbi:MAG: hypothetical protein PHU49_07990 [Syntrophorhabdaceae bacterium]|nr:hypothetical protein [Syntrophorhabdaceae bacterium]MDD5243944.1 hypothetical protein [Syntrophorhabdaceae bacterium]
MEETAKQLKERIGQMEVEYAAAIASKDRRKILSLANRIHHAKLKLASIGAGESIERQRRRSQKKVSLQITISVEPGELQELFKLFSKEVN